MTLNIVANRKLSLKGFAEGWDDCHLLVRGVNERTRQQLQESLQGKGDKEAADIVRQLCLDVIVGGVVMSTNDEGVAQPVEITKADITVVVDALNIAWQQEVASIATGADRLKAILN